MATPQRRPVPGQFTPDRLQTPDPQTPFDSPNALASVRLPGEWPTPGADRRSRNWFSRSQNSGGVPKTRQATEIFNGPPRAPDTPVMPNRYRYNRPLRRPGVRVDRRVSKRSQENKLTVRDLRTLKRQRNQPTILRLNSWSPKEVPLSLPAKTWTEYFFRWCRFGGQPYSDDPVWTKELIFETVDNGSLQDWLDALEGTEDSGFHEGQIWHTLLSLLHALLWLHRGRTFTNRNWFLRDTPDPLPGPDDWKPVFHGQIDPDHILFNQAMDRHRPYGDTKLYVPPDAVVLPSIRARYFEKPDPKTFYTAPEHTWMTGRGRPAWLIAPQGTKADIWSVGAVCFRMMGGPSYPDQDTYNDADRFWCGQSAEQRFDDLSWLMYDQNYLSRWQPDDLPKEYSPYLRAAVSNLLHFVPRDRPDIEDAIQYARTEFTAWRRRVDANTYLTFNPLNYPDRAPARAKPVPRPKSQMVADDNAVADPFVEPRSPVVGMFNRHFQRLPPGGPVWS